MCQHPEVSLIPFGSPPPLPSPSSSSSSSFPHHPHPTDPGDDDVAAGGNGVTDLRTVIARKKGGGAHLGIGSSSIGNRLGPRNLRVRVAVGGVGGVSTAAVTAAAAAAAANAAAPAGARAGGAKGRTGRPRLASTLTHQKGGLTVVVKGGGGGRGRDDEEEMMDADENGMPGIIPAAKVSSTAAMLSRLHARVSPCPPLVHRIILLGCGNRCGGQRQGSQA